MDQNHIIEIIPQHIFETMKYDIFTGYKNAYQLDTDYIKQRKEIFDTIHKLSNKLCFKSQTFFLSTYYLDLILFQNSIPSNKYYLLALGCLVIASKYSENDPVVPPLENFIILFNKIKKMEYPLTFEQLYKMEVKICKLLKYNLHYVTSYDFDFFFFNHGIIKKEQIIEILSIDNDDNETDKEFVLDGNYVKKILEKIYRKSRSFLNLVVYSDTLCFKYNSLLLSIYIMKKSVEFVILEEYKTKKNYCNLLRKDILIKTNNYFKEIMNNFYKIDYESSVSYQELIKDKEAINIFPRLETESISEINKKNLIENNNNNINPIISSTLEDVPSSNKLLKSMTMKNNYKVLNGKINIKKTLNSKKSNYNVLFTKNNRVNQFDRISKNYSTNKYQKIKINIKKDFSVSNRRRTDKYSNINFSDYKSLCKLNIFTEKSIDKSTHFNDSQSPEKFTYNNKISSNNLRPQINVIKLGNSNNNIYRYSTLYNENRNKSVEKNNEIICNNDNNNKTKPYFKKVIHNNVMKTVNKKTVITGLINRSNTIKNEYLNNLSLSMNANKKLKNRLVNIPNSGTKNNKGNINDENYVYQNRKTMEYTNLIFNSQEKSKEKIKEKVKKNKKSDDRNSNTNSNTNIIYNYYFSNNNYYTNNQNIKNTNNNINVGFYKNKIGSESNVLTNINNSNVNFSIESSRKSTTNNLKNSGIVNLKYCNLNSEPVLNNKKNNYNNYSNLKKNISPKTKNNILYSESFYKKKINSKNFTRMKYKVATSKNVRNTTNSMKNFDSNSSVKKSKNIYPSNKNKNYEKKLLHRFVKKNTFNTIDTYNNVEDVNNIKQNLNFDNEDEVR